MNDLTADMLTRIRNAVRNRERTVMCIANKLNAGVAAVLVEEGYLEGVERVDDGRQGLLRLKLKYGSRGEQAINVIERVSRGGRRVYRGVEELPRPLQGLGIAIVSTSHGVMSDRRCRVEKLGGEVVATVY
ncbi:MAG: 30S ribosomal protein S8 [Phycisphaerae bacterium]|nr:30S ribosomal protein S8 [Phycisphaerae bacterium]